jgi:asparagine synthase (glutamine-hydrolysing)
MKKWVNGAKTRAYLELRQRRDAEGTRLASRIRQEKLTFLGMGALLDLRRRVLEADRRGVPGDLVEAGCALGGSAILMALSKLPDRELYLHDVFGTIPPPTDQDGPDVKERYETILRGDAQGFDGDVYYGYQPNLRDSVAHSFARFGVPVEANNVHLVEGLFQDTIRPTGPVAVAHIDGDWYESTKVCLERLWPVLSPGGVAIIDDYGAWSGCRTATDEFLEGRSDVIREQHSRLHLIKR